MECIEWLEVDEALLQHEHNYSTEMVITLVTDGDQVTWFCPDIIY